MNTRKNTTLRDDYGAQKLVEFLVVADRELEVTRDDPRFFVVASGVSGEFENLGAEVLEDGSEVDWEKKNWGRRRRRRTGTSVKSRGGEVPIAHALTNDDDHARG